MHLIFVDHDAQLIAIYERIIGPGMNGDVCTFITGDIRVAVTKLHETYGTLDYLVSPANSHGLMDGGIDDIYRFMFPKIQNRVQAKIRKKYPETHLVPIGECFSIKILKMKRYKIPIVKELIVCPTMVVPSDIRGTDNVYLATRSLITFLRQQDNKNIIVVIPGMGTGIGLVPFEESANQILRALTE